MQLAPATDDQNYHERKPSTDAAAVNYACRHPVLDLETAVRSPSGAGASGEDPGSRPATMPTYKSSQDWLEQARLLLEAHPETVRRAPALPGRAR